MNKIKEIIMDYRKKDLMGKIIDLSPVIKDDLSNIVRMRNDPKMMYFLNQPQKLTLESQMAWYDNYEKRTNDLYWSIKDKNGLLVGTNRLYEITKTKCVQGSLIIDSQYSRTAPFAIEAILLSLDFAFNTLGVQTIINEDRHDNKNMNSLSRRFGFQFLKKTDIRGITYNYYELQEKHYNREAIIEVINLWLNR